MVLDTKKLKKKIDHVGIAVQDINKAIKTYTDLLSAQLSHQETIESQGVQAAFIQIGKQSIELLQALNEDSPVAKFIAKRGEGVHHVAIKVKNIREEMARMKKDGYRLINSEPVLGANNKWVCFIHPKEANGVLIELCQKRKEVKRRDG